MKDYEVIKSYVFHKEQCFFVSTIERDCGYPHRYNETIVWEYDWAKRERKADTILYMGEDSKGSIRRHQLMCEELYKIGKIEDNNH